MMKVLCSILTLSAAFSNLNVHVVVHSHLDPGWLKTIDFYYSVAVEKIFNSVLD